MTLSMIFIIPDFMSRAGYYVKSSVLRIIVTLMLAVLAQAGQAESFEQRLENRLETDDVVEVYEWLQSIEDEYGDQVPYLDLRSRFAMRLEDYANAIPVLERLIEVQPGHMGARLDLVIALQLEGRSFALVDPSDSVLVHQEDGVQSGRLRSAPDLLAAGVPELLERGHTSRR